MSRWLSVCFMALSLCASAQSVSKDYFRMMTLNTENLFDTVHDAGKDDLEFSVKGVRRWTPSRYKRKLSRIAKIIAAAGDKQPIELIALCEVENDSVMVHLTKRYPLKLMGYEYFMTNSADVRGLDVALLYQPLRFRPLYHTSFHVPRINPIERPTRDILYVKGLLPTADTLHIFVCHFPSKASGAAATHGYRMRAAKAVKQRTDSIMAIDQQSRIIITGDLNDIPQSTIISEGFGAQFADDTQQPCSPSSLYLLTHGLKAANGIEGTYKFQGRWEQIDHFIISGQLLAPSAAINTTQSACRILDLPFLLKPDDTNGGVKPYRSFLGPQYIDGFTDHLPILLTFEINWQRVAP